jgi:methionyl-tRNA formyltransferase
VKYIVAAVGLWNKTAFEVFSSQFSGEWYFADNPDILDNLLKKKKIEPRYIFFPHWRWIVPSEIVSQYECICFHMTDVPYGRGGSPLQNLILRGHKATVLTALRMDNGIDTGPVYCKKPLELHGKAAEIYERTTELTWDIIGQIVIEQLQPTPQCGPVTEFKRRKPEQSEIPVNLSIEQIYDYIRMLDAPDYPRAFIQYDSFCIEFEDASYSDNEVIAKVRIKNKD